MYLKSVRKHLPFMPGVKTSGLCHIVTSMIYILWISKLIAFSRGAAESSRKSMWVKEKMWRKRNLWIRLPLAWVEAYAACLLLIHLSLPPSIQTVPKVQTFWWCCCLWQEQSCSSAWRLCSSGNCWSRSMTDESLPNLRKNALVLSGTRSVNIARCAVCVGVCKCSNVFKN